MNARFVVPPLVQAAALAAACLPAVLAFARSDAAAAEPPSTPVLRVYTDYV